MKIRLAVVLLTCFLLVGVLIVCWPRSDPTGDLEDLKYKRLVQKLYDSAVNYDSQQGALPDSLSSLLTFDPSLDQLVQGCTCETNNAVARKKLGELPGSTWLIRASGRKWIYSMSVNGFYKRISHSQ